MNAICDAASSCASTSPSSFLLDRGSVDSGLEHAFWSQVA